MKNSEIFLSQNCIKFLFKKLKFENVLKVHLTILFTNYNAKTYV